MRSATEAPTIKSLTDAGDLARQLLPEAAFDYCAGGASNGTGAEAGLKRNVSRLDDHVLIPRVFGGIATPDTKTAVPGGTLTAPLLVTPMGLQGLCHAEAEVGTAAAAARLGLGFVRSMFASRTIEEVAAAVEGGVWWQQIYLLRDQELTSSVAARAEAAGASALVVTADVPVVGSRPRSARHQFDRFAVAPPAIVGDPYFARLLTERQRSDPGYPAKELLDELFPNPDVGWQDLTRLTERSRLPVLLKGVLDPRDARQALACGAAGVVVSTHGGRQSALHPAAIDALTPIVTTVGDEMPVYFDSGVRTGEHLAVAISTGARAVLVGRPVLWGLAAAGYLGAEQVLRLLVSQLWQTMVLAGAADIAELQKLTILDYGAPATRGGVDERPC